MLCPATNPTARSLAASGGDRPRGWPPCRSPAAPIGAVERTGGGHAAELLELQSTRSMRRSSPSRCSPRRHWPRTTSRRPSSGPRHVVGPHLGPGVLAVGDRGDGLAGPGEHAGRSTSRSPGVLGTGRVTVVVEDPAVWTRAGPTDRPGWSPWPALLWCRDVAGAVPGVDACTGRWSGRGRGVGVGGGVPGWWSAGCRCGRRRSRSLRCCRVEAARSGSPGWTRRPARSGWWARRAARCRPSSWPWPGWRPGAGHRKVWAPCARPV